MIRHSFPNIDVFEAQAKAKSFGLEWAKANKLYPGALELLNALKADPKYKLGLLTNGRADFQRAILDYFELSKYFDIIIVSGEEGIRKPDSEIFKIMAKKMELSTKSLFMIGDALEKEIKPAIQLGWGGVWIKPDTEQTTINSDSVDLQNLLASSRFVPTKLLNINWLNVKI